MPLNTPFIDEIKNIFDSNAISTSGGSTYKKFYNCLSTAIRYASADLPANLSENEQYTEIAAREESLAREVASFNDYYTRSWGPQSWTNSFENALNSRQKRLFQERIREHITQSNRIIILSDKVKKLNELKAEVEILRAQNSAFLYAQATRQVGIDVASEFTENYQAAFNEAKHLLLQSRAAAPQLCEFVESTHAMMQQLVGGLQIMDRLPTVEKEQMNDAQAVDENMAAPKNARVPQVAAEMEQNQRLQAPRGQAGFLFHQQQRTENQPAAEEEYKTDNSGRKITATQNCS